MIVSIYTRLINEIRKGVKCYLINCKNENLIHNFYIQKHNDNISIFIVFNNKYDDNVFSCFRYGVKYNIIVRFDFINGVYYLDYLSKSVLKKKYQLEKELYTYINDKYTLPIELEQNEKYHHINIINCVCGYIERINNLDGK